MADLEPGAALRITVRDDPAGAVIALGGDLDVSNADELAAALDPLLAAKPARLVFDLAELRFMDSSGIAQLLRSAAVVPVSVVHVSHIVRRVLEATGLIEALGVEP
ncbi:MAG TPA: STAS domain-containing protein [Acidimicrobiales bacterium]|nr:STAS domain-containing protein [Acidimicrobiales bacterium]